MVENMLQTCQSPHKSEYEKPCGFPENDNVNVLVVSEEEFMHRVYGFPVFLIVVQH